LPDTRAFPFPTLHAVRPERPVDSVCVYCGSRQGFKAEHAALARALGTRLAELNITLIYGGGSIGLMGVIANACLDAGGKVVGIIPTFLDELEVGHKEISERVLVGDMHARKREMINRADAFVALPGGLGTLDELAEAITWRQLGLHNKPIYLIGDHSYWQPFVTLFEHFIAEGFAHETGMSLFTQTDTLDSLIGHLTHG